MRTLVGLLAAVCCSAQTAPSDARERARQLVVKITATVGENEVVGSGLVAGRTREHIFVVTANHVVRRATEQATNVKVRFPWLPGWPYDGQLLELYDADMDIAVIGVSQPPKSNIPFDRLAPPSSAKQGDKVYMIGYPAGAAYVSPAPDLVTGTPGHRILFESSSIAPGHSGGGLFNERFELIGMIRSERPPNGEAVRIDLILQTLKDPTWGYRVDLREPLPASGPTTPTTPAVPAVTATAGPLRALRPAVAPRSIPPISGALVWLGSASFARFHERQFEVIASELVKHNVALAGLVYDSLDKLAALTVVFGADRPAVFNSYTASSNAKGDKVLMVNFPPERMEAAILEVINSGRHAYVFANPESLRLPREFFDMPRRKGLYVRPGDADATNLGSFFAYLSVRSGGANHQVSPAVAMNVWRKFYDDLDTIPLRRDVPPIPAKLWLGSIPMTYGMTALLAELPVKLRENGVSFSGIACATPQDAEALRSQLQDLNRRTVVYSDFAGSLRSRTKVVLLMNFGKDGEESLEEATMTALNAGEHVFRYYDFVPRTKTDIFSRAKELGKALNSGYDASLMQSFFRRVRELEPIR